MVFFKKMDGMASRLDKAVFIADGAKWIWNWVDDHYPDSTQVLDFFHCKEKLCDFAKVAISSSEKQDSWIAAQSNCLLEDGIDQVIETISNTKTTAGKATQTKRRLLNYYEVNRKRMKHKTFRDKGLLIGSGAMESAHRTVVQSRLKRSPKESFGQASDGLSKAHKTYSTLEQSTKVDTGILSKISSQIKADYCRTPHSRSNLSESDKLVKG